MLTILQEITTHCAKREQQDLCSIREDRLGKLKVAILLQCNQYQVTELIVYLQTTISNEEEMKHQGQGQNIL